MSREWAVSLLIAGMVGVSGCEEEKPVPPPPVLQGEGDWTDTGRYAACNVYSVQGRECGDRETIEVSSCDAASLAQVPAEGIYTLVYRTDSQVPASSRTPSGCRRMAASTPFTACPRRNVASARASSS
ncbi:hypothetical protein ACN28S_60445 [Cystobacter fuscus]